MGTMALLHWLVSEAIFMVNIKVLDPYGNKIEHFWRKHYYVTPLSFSGTSLFDCLLISLYLSLISGFTVFLWTGGKQW